MTENGEENVQKWGKEGEILPDGRVTHHRQSIMHLNAYFILIARGLLVVIILWNIIMNTNSRDINYLKLAVDKYFIWNN